MFELTDSQQTVALLVVAALALVGLFLSLVLAWRLVKVRREYAVLRGEGSEEDVIAAVSRATKRVDEINRRADALWADQQGQQELRRLSIQKFAVVRYNAFEDVGGMLSFSLALLNDHGDGVVISTINGRTETRTYAKAIKQLTSDHNLSEEEREAIAAAMAGYGRGESRAEISR